MQRKRFQRFLLSVEEMRIRIIVKEDEHLDEDERMMLGWFVESLVRLNYKNIT